MFNEKLVYSSDGHYLISEYMQEAKKPHFKVWEVKQDYSLYSDNQSTIAHGGDKLYASPDNRVYSWRNFSREGDTKPKIYFYTVPEMEQSGYLQDYEVPDNVSISPNGRYMVDTWRPFGKYDVGKQFFSRLRIWSYPEMVLKKELFDIAIGKAVSFAWTSDSRYLLYGPPATDKDIKSRFYHQSMKLVDIKTYRKVEKFDPMDSSPIMLGFLDNERYIMTLTDKRTLDIWDRKSGKRIERYKFPNKGWAFSGLQNPADKSRIAYNHKDEIWIMEIQDLY